MQVLIPAVRTSDWIEPGEDIVLDDVANLNHPAIAVGGMLFLTLDRLAFIPHRKNLTKTPTFIPLVDIEAVGSAMTRVFFVPLAFNSFQVRTRERAFRFTVNDRREWIDAVSEFARAARCC